MSILKTLLNIFVYRVTVLLIYFSDRLIAKGGFLIHIKKDWGLYPQVHDLLCTIL